MGIYRRENGIWYAYCPWRTELNLPPRLSLKTKNRKRAEVEFEQLKFRESYEGKITKPQRINIKDYFEQYLHDYSRQNKTPKNYQIDRDRLKIIYEYFRDQDIFTLAKLTHRAIEGLKKHLLDTGKSAKTVNHYLAHLRTALNLAIRYFNEDEIKKILSVADQEAREYILIILNTGLRLSEMIHLKWSDIDIKKRMIAVQASQGFSPKSRKISIYRT